MYAKKYNTFNMCRAIDTADKINDIKCVKQKKIKINKKQIQYKNVKIIWKKITLDETILTTVVHSRDSDMVPRSMPTNE